MLYGLPCFILVEKQEPHSVKIDVCLAYATWRYADVFADSNSIFNQQAMISMNPTPEKGQGMNQKKYCVIKNNQMNVEFPNNSLHIQDPSQNYKQYLYYIFLI